MFEYSAMRRHEKTTPLSSPHLSSTKWGEMRPTPGRVWGSNEGKGLKVGVPDNSLFPYAGAYGLVLRARVSGMTEPEDYSPCVPPICQSTKWGERNKISAGLRTLGSSSGIGVECLTPLGGSSVTPPTPPQAGGECRLPQAGGILRPRQAARYGKE
jgi:hypothetical protein